MSLSIGQLSLFRGSGSRAGWRARILALGLGCVTLYGAHASASDRPNILWLVSEDNTTMLGCYGDSTARTPTLDKLAQEGVLFERCFAQPVCAPSRFTLITGLPAVSCGPANHMRAEGKIPSGLKGFPALLKAAGYFTANCAKTDYNAPIRIRETWSESGRTAHYTNRLDISQPFFSVFNHEITHESCLFPEQDVRLDFKPTDPEKVRVPSYLPDTPEIRADTARYYDHIALMDLLIAAKLADLEKVALAENTIVFYFADNGGVLPRSKRFLLKSGTHVPLIVRFPPKWAHLAPALPGSRIRNPVSFVDFAPTVLSLAGVKIPDYMKGRQFAGLNRATNQFVYCTRDRMDEQYDTIRSVVNERWLYVRNFRPDLAYVQPLDYMFRARGYQSWARVAREGRLTPATSRFWGEKPLEELYDLSNDPDNVNNLAQETACKAVLEQMRAALKARVLEVQDNGFLPEGSPSEGFNAVRAKTEFPVEAAYAMACLASERLERNLPALLKGLGHQSEPVRWWAAQGCAMLRDKSRPAEAALLRVLEQDSSGAVQIAAAEALAFLGQTNQALPVLERWVVNLENPAFALQAANVLDRLGPIARPSLPKMQAALNSLPDNEEGARMQSYLRRMLQRTTARLKSS